MKAVVVRMTILWTLVSASAAADPSATLKYLVAEPATLLDVGMLRLEAAMDELAHDPSMRLQFASGSETPVVTTYSPEPRH